MALASRTAIKTVGLGATLTPVLNGQTVRDPSPLDDGFLVCPNEAGHIELQIAAVVEKAKAIGIITIVVLAKDSAGLCHLGRYFPREIATCSKAFGPLKHVPPLGVGVDMD